jgi:spoIIIJ-associated protein
MLTFDEAAIQEEQEPAQAEELPLRSAGPDRDGGHVEPAAPRPEELAAGAAVLTELLSKMRVQADVEVSEDGTGVDVLGPDLGALIGRGGEGLIAMQQIVSAITSRQVGRTVHVPVDIEGYRRRREEQLRDVALRVAGRVRASGQAVTLEPMLAYERRIVHLAVQAQPGIRTESVGVEPNRRIVISSTAPGARSPSAAPRPPRPGPSYGPRRDFGPRPGGLRPRPGGPGPTTGGRAS